VRMMGIAKKPLHPSYALRALFCVTQNSFHVFAGEQDAR
jgi:hypothetical protein